jgi:hypothetical protein
MRGSSGRDDEAEKREIAKDMSKKSALQKAEPTQ